MIMEGQYAISNAKQVKSKSFITLRVVNNIFSYLMPREC